MITKIMDSVLNNKWPCYQRRRKYWWSTSWRWKEYPRDEENKWPITNW